MLLSIHLAYVLGALPFAERFAKAAELGFNAVEFPFPYGAAPAATYAELLARHGLTQISIGAPTTDYRSGEPGWAVDPDRRSEFTASLHQAVDYARQISCPCIHVFSGVRRADIPDAVMDEVYRENLAEAARLFAREGLRLLVEPINTTDFPGYYLDTAAKALAAMDGIGSDNIKLIADIYHLNVVGESPVDLLRREHARIEHLQFADYPGRHELGTGRLDFAAILRTLAAVGYTGSCGLEYIPTRAVEAFVFPPELAVLAKAAGRPTAGRPAAS